MSGYLWDRSGDVDPEIAELEKLLGPLGDPGTPRRRRPVSWARWALAVAATLGVVAGGAWLWRENRRPGWVIEAASGPAVLRAGEWFTAGEKARVKVGEIGRVDLEPGSRVRLESAAAGAYRMRLELGKLEAFIVAPPRSFAVETPAAVAVDLGCAYSLEVKPDGESIVRVSAGWVSFARERREVFIPAGARCRTGGRAGGLGVPLYDDAGRELNAAVEAFEATGHWRLPGDLRARDALTLWHLLPRLEGEERGKLYDALARLVPLPAQAERQAVLAGDQRALDEIWRALGLGDAGFWRHWQQAL